MRHRLQGGRPRVIHHKHGTRPCVAYHQRVFVRRRHSRSRRVRRRRVGSGDRGGCRGRRGTCHVCGDRLGCVGRCRSYRGGDVTRLFGQRPDAGGRRGHALSAREPIGAVRSVRLHGVLVRSF